VYVNNEALSRSTGKPGYLRSEATRRTTLFNFISMPNAKVFAEQVFQRAILPLFLEKDVASKRIIDYRPD
jgi:hypothetical protein